MTFEQVIALNPDLGRNGWNFKPNGVTGSIDPVADREAFGICRKFLERLLLIKSPQRRMGSYGLKHLIEQDQGKYNPNGVLIAAALSLPVLKVERSDDGPNSIFNFSTRRDESERIQLEAEVCPWVC
jgi:hypothetical protein